MSEPLKNKGYIVQDWDLGRCEEDYRECNHKAIAFDKIDIFSAVEWLKKEVKFIFEFEPTYEEITKKIDLAFEDVALEDD